MRIYIEMPSIWFLMRMGKEKLQLIGKLFCSGMENQRILDDTCNNKSLTYQLTSNVFFFGFCTNQDQKKIYGCEKIYSCLLVFMIVSSFWFRHRVPKVPLAVIIEFEDSEIFKNPEKAHFIFFIAHKSIEKLAGLVAIKRKLTCYRFLICFS